MSTLVRRNDGQRGLMRPFFQDFFDIENFFGRDVFPTSKSLPAVNISEDEQTYHIDVVSPGFKKEDFKVNIENNVLTISAETKQETTNNQDGNKDDKNKQYRRREYSYSSFTRSFQLPENVKEDDIDASYTDGILKLQIPKEEQQAKTSKEINIR
jgi:HSP20 family protein